MAGLMCCGALLTGGAHVEKSYRLDEHDLRLDHLSPVAKFYLIIILFIIIEKIMFSLYFSFDNLHSTSSSITMAMKSEIVGPS